MVTPNHSLTIVDSTYRDNRHINTTTAPLQCSVFVPSVVALRRLFDLGIHLVPVAADREAERAWDATEVAQPGGVEGRRTGGFGRASGPRHKTPVRPWVARWLVPSA